MTAGLPDSLPWTNHPDADRLLATDSLALLIGMLLDQQFPMERAFLGPYLLSERLGRALDAGGDSRMGSRRDGLRLPRPPGYPPLSGVDGQTHAGHVWGLGGDL